MAKNMPSKRATGPSFMFPSLHQAVANAVADDIPSTCFHEEDSDSGSNQNYLTNVMGKFRCNNKNCSTGGWGSKMVAMVIRGYPDNGYNAVIFNQHCKSCKRLGMFTLDKQSYVERIAYRLKRWAGVAVEQPPYSTRESLPHESSLCEGCRRGSCPQARALACR